jgi:hypothetical protein
MEADELHRKLIDEIVDLRAQRDALAEALRDVMDTVPPFGCFSEKCDKCDACRARAALAKVTP